MDSRALIALFVSTLGLLVVGSVFMLVWSVASGQWDDSEKPKFKILEAESDGEPKNN
ncbi:MAG TPA: cbb3-type cytochrome oxidase assembly protein CcoS [Elusimicrobiota bacterium]|nr:cbb3-type cytochrome oxidase assembly protein CcoS [Elusimicrobiota bacterium]